jgi:hypothetical protein
LNGIDQRAAVEFCEIAFGAHNEAIAAKIVESTA